MDWVPCFHSATLRSAGPRSAVGKVSECRYVLTTDPVVRSLILSWSHTFVEIDHEIISMAIILLSPDSRRVGLLSVTSESMCTNYWLTA